MQYLNFVITYPSVRCTFCCYCYTFKISIWQVAFDV